MVLGLFVILTKIDARNFSQIAEKVRKNALPEVEVGRGIFCLFAGNFVCIKPFGGIGKHCVHHVQNPFALFLVQVFEKLLDLE